jgi:hypothetical protein
VLTGLRVRQGFSLGPHLCAEASGLQRLRYALLSPHRKLPCDTPQLCGTLITRPNPTMQPLNAIDAVAPAFTRTHQTLFAPFRIGRSWKLAATQALGFYGSMFVPVPLFLLLIPASVFNSVPALRTTLLIGGAAYMLVYLVILYFCARLELVSFEMLVTRAQFVAPMWRRYSARIWPWFGFKILVGTLYTALLAAIFFAPIHQLVLNFMASAHSMHLPGGRHPDPEAMQAFMAPFIQQMAIVQMLSYLILFLMKIPSTLLNDFVLPFFVLEDIPLLAALARGFEVFRADPLQVLLYLILKPILFLIGYIMQSVALTVTLIPVIILFIIGAIITGLTSHHSGAGIGAIAGIAIIGYIVLFALMFWLSFGLLGYLTALLEAYGIYFLGGRYRLLGNLLEPGLDRPFTPPPVFPSDEERRDDDGGPPMPMDPAVA